MSHADVIPSFLWEGLFQTASYLQTKGVMETHEKHNPMCICCAATWMLEISTSAEQRLGRDFADLFEESELARWPFCRHSFNSLEQAFSCSTAYQAFSHSSERATCPENT